MLGQVRKVSLAGERDDDPLQAHNRPLLDEEQMRATDQLLLAVAEIDYQEDIIRQREAGINEIQRDVNTIHGLFQDVALHVTQQGQMLDNIESNVIAAGDRTREANVHLEAASRRYPNTRRNIFCFSALALMLLLLVALFRDLFRLAAGASLISSYHINDLPIVL